MNRNRTERRFRGSTGVGRVVIALMLTLAACVATAGTAGAAAVTESARGTSGVAAPDFSAQARGAGLSGAEAASLQAKVDARLAEWGGTQVAANKILLPQAEVTLPLPGERSARDLDAAGGAVAAASCPYTYVCAFSGPDFTGTKIALFTCDSPYRIYWSGTGSWINNQRAALTAKFYDSSQILRWTSPGGYSEDRYADWSWVYWLSPC
ncbi:peptidase inhibitor family I36 protein [Streptomyces sp. NPDC058620]|uniref:peptidase inhibitor family I36 protein n=1 Tax=Streptomyces sp. NPDC058620 TaxID=3346560 RepID=UPI003665072E